MSVALSGQRCFALPIALIVGAALAGCDASATLPTPASVYAVPYNRQIVASDVIAMSRYAQILSMIPRDSTMIVLTHSSADVIDNLDGVRGICQSLGTDSTARVELYFKVAPAPVDSGVALMQRFGSSHYSVVDGDIVGGYLPAYRLDALQEYPLLSWLDVNTCPATQGTPVAG